MHLLLLTVLAATGLLSEAVALPTDTKTATVEIEKQRLVKFPDELAEQPGADVAHGKGEKIDEAKRILEQIDKVNKALGYVKKQPQQAAQAKTPPMLDSSQYLFPKPAYQPFHEQHHQMEGSHGETILVPSIRAVRLDAAYAQEQQRSKGAADATPGAYNVPPLKQQPKHKPQDQAAQAEQQHLSKPQSQKLKTQSQMQYFFRPSQVQVPAPQSANEQQQLPTHFVIPVHLYKLNKAEYLQKYAPLEYRVKGYKIVGDIDHFYGKAKQKGHKSGNSNNKKNKTTAAKREKGENRTSLPKYHLFFLPRELAVNEDSTSRQKQRAPNAAPNATDQLTDTSSREEKLANRPYKIQATASTSNKNGASNNTANTQIVRKRIVPKPLRDKETSVGSVAIQQLPGGGTATAGTTIHIAPTPLANLNGIGQQAGNNNNNNNGNASPNFRPNTNNNNFNLFNRFGSNSNSNNNDMSPNDNSNNSNSNIIKTAFQNIFKLPFLPGGRPELVTEAPQMAAAPLEAPQKLFFNASPLLPQSFYNPEHMYNNNNNNNNNNHNHNSNDNSNHHHNNNQDDWVDADNSNSADEDESTASDTDAEKGIFGNRLQELQTAHREAMKQGGIIIQRLKVRKGGIAIAGPGGVATAGSGGTAIVGPGGYALTHPRSLTIAGPGAKVIAIPASVDLRDALERTNLQSGTFPREGKIVATGPTVYFAPETGAMLEL